MYWHLPPLIWWIVVPFLAWRVVVRLKRLLSRQRYSHPLQWARATGLYLLTILVALVAFEEHAAFIALAIGLGIGVLLGVWGVRLTKLEPVDGETFYQPDRYLGAALSVLLLGRIVWRIYADPTEPTGWTLAAFVRNPSTMVLFGLFSAHYIVYALGLIYWVKRKVR
jgi:hypothetical protein